MAFSDWDLYDKLLYELESVPAQWSGADSFESFDSTVRSVRADLLEGEHGYRNLIAELEGSEDTPSSPSRQGAEREQQAYDTWLEKQVRKTSETDLEEASEEEPTT